MSEEKNAFRFSIPPGAPGSSEKVVYLTAERAEQFLLDQLAASGDRFQELWRLVSFYSRAGRAEEAERYFQRIESLDDPELDPVDLAVGLGQLNEQREEFRAAESCYRRALTHRPSKGLSAYYAHNNLAYCLNLRGVHGEAEALCRQAIAIDPRRHNAYKNLGVSLEGLGRFDEAARAYIEATKANAVDIRALNHLTALLDGHPEIRDVFPEVDGQIAMCREATQLAVGMWNAPMGKDE
jgi:tetratricopeptide (TPR) repeat protein